MADIEDMIAAINAQAHKLGRKSNSKYVRSSKWLSYNKDRFNIEDYENATETRKEVIYKDVFRNYENMPTKETLRADKDDFINNFNKAADNLGVDFSVNNRNFNDFKDFVGEYEERVKDLKFKDSGQIIQMFLNFRQHKKEFADVKEFFTDYIKKEQEGIFE